MIRTECVMRIVLDLFPLSESMIIFHDNPVPQIFLSISSLALLWNIGKIKQNTQKSEIFFSIIKITKCAMLIDSNLKKIHNLTK